MQKLYRTLVLGWIGLIGAALVPLAVAAAPFAAYVMDARTGKEIYSQNADARLHPASLTKMMTLYMAFSAIEQGRVRLDSRFTVSPYAASMPPSRLGLRPGQQIELRYLIRAAAVKSANDAATVICEGLAGSQQQFAANMTATARALGMRNSTFRNCNGLSEPGHLSTARDLSLLGRRLFYDFPQYYSIFSRRVADAGVATVASTNKRFLDGYPGADGIKTGYTQAAGFNLTASAQRGSKRLVATVMGAQSTAQRNAIMAQLMDAGFGNAPTQVQEIRPATPDYLVDRRRAVQVTTASAAPDPVPQVDLPSRRLIALAAPAAAARSVQAAPRPVVAQPAPQPVPPAPMAVAKVTPAPVVAPEPERKVTKAGAAALAAERARPNRRPAADSGDEAEDVAARTDRPSRAPRKTPGSTVALSDASKAEPPGKPAKVVKSAAPKRKSDTVILAALDGEGDAAEREPAKIVSRPSTKGSRNYGITLGRLRSKHDAEQLLLRIALQENDILDGARRSVADTAKGFQPRFGGLTQDAAKLACGKLSAAGQNCSVTGP